jgi:lycopene beta-cyclase
VAENSYDYIIAGGGLAGLSLAFYLNRSSLKNKKILLIDRDAKTANDHTWCFWQKEKSAFEEIVFHRWKTLWFHGTGNFSELLNFGEYEYKMIRAVDFYAFIRKELSCNPNISFLQSEIQSMHIETAFVKTANGEFLAKEYVFDSLTRKDYDNPKYQNLWQHFVGWKIETDENVFTPDQATLFDFRVEQKGECRFIYILPFSPNKALLEYTVFSDNLLEKNEYEFYLKDYISRVLKTENYKVIEIESGVIPMSDEPHIQMPSPKIIRIGTTGGYVKPSTGYSFARTQRYLQKLVANLEAQHSALGTRHSFWKMYLDSVLLNVLRTKKHSAADVFTQLFKRNETEQVLKFLDEETNLSEDLRIMRSVPLAPFIKAALEEAPKLINRTGN